MHPTLSPESLRAAQHDAAEGELRAHPAPERCDCPGHDLFLALAAVAAAYAHEDLSPGQTCQSRHCGYREPMTRDVGTVILDAPAPGQLGAWEDPEDVEGSVVDRPGSDGAPAMFVAPWAPA